jgi:hypothetical protein
MMMDACPQNPSKSGSFVLYSTFEISIFVVGLGLPRQGYPCVQIHYIEYSSSFRDCGPSVINRSIFYLRIFER